MVVSTFSVLDKDDRERFFEKSFILADVKPRIVFGMPFLTINNADINFQARNLQWRSYIIGDVLPTIRRVELIEKKEFVAVALNPEYKAFIIHVTALTIDPDNEVHPSKRIQIAYLKADKSLTKVLSEYTDFADVFSLKLAIELLEYMGINDHTIKLVDN